MSGILVPADNIAALDALMPEARDLAVTNMLTEARSWLARAIDVTEPQTIANFKAQMATVAEATKQLGLSKEIQLDAQEMVRRAERGVGKAIRKGQAEGTVTTRGERPLQSSKRSVSDVLPAGSESALTYAVTDGVSDEQFDEAVDEAKAEGKLSRANVVRKVKGQDGEPRSSKRTAERIEALAAQGWTSAQIADQIGMVREYVRKLARKHNIQIPADKTIGIVRAIDSNRIVNEIVRGLEGTRMAIDLIDYTDLDRGETPHWANSLDESIRALNRLRKHIKELTQ